MNEISIAAESIQKKPNYMKAVITCMSLLACVFQFVSAQENEHKFDANITGGISLPTGKFANKNYVKTFDKPNGLAKNGYGINATFCYLHREKFGFSLLFGYSSNDQDLSDFEKVTRPAYYSNIGKVDIIESTWKIFKAMPGVYFETSLTPGSKFIIRPVLSAGLCKTVKSESKIYYYGTDGSILAATQSDKISFPLSFCFQGDINLIYSINKKIYALFDSHYFFGNPPHKFSYQNSSGNTVAATTRYNLSSINIMIGAGIKIR